MKNTVKDLRAFLKRKEDIKNSKENIEISNITIGIGVIGLGVAIGCTSYLGINLALGIIGYIALICITVATLYGLPTDYRELNHLKDSQHENASNLDLKDSQHENASNLDFMFLLFSVLIMLSAIFAPVVIYFSTKLTFREAFINYTQALLDLQNPLSMVLVGFAGLALMGSFIAFIAYKKNLKAPLEKIMGEKFDNKSISISKKSESAEIFIRGYENVVYSEVLVDQKSTNYFIDNKKYKYVLTKTDDRLMGNIVTLPGSEVSLGLVGDEVEIKL